MAGVSVTFVNVAFCLPFSSEGSYEKLLNVLLGPALMFCIVSPNASG